MFYISESHLEEKIHYVSVILLSGCAMEYIGLQNFVLVCMFCLSRGRRKYVDFNNFENQYSAV